MWPSDLSPDHSDLGASDLPLRTVDKCDFLTEVESVCTLRKLQRKSF